MSDFHRVVHPDKVPAKPLLWSYSSLREFGECPKRWSLTRSEYSNTPGSGYPGAPSVQRVRGNVVHDVITAFENEYAREGGSVRDFFKAFGLRSRVALEIENQVDAEHQSNPRVVSRKAITPLLDECISQIKSVVLSLPEKESVESNKRKTGRKRGANVRIEVSDPDVVAYLDYFDGSQLVEFKSGPRNESHEEQVRFYAAVLYRSTGSAPAALEINYTGEGASVHIDPMNSDACEALLSEIRRSIKENNESIDAQEIEARTGEACRFCSVRHLCDEYWVSISVLSREQARYTADIEVQLVQCVRESVAGAVYEIVDGESNKGILTHSAGFEVMPDGAKVRVLKAHINWKQGPIMVSVRSDSELFLLSEV